MSLWAMSGAPLIVGTDLTKLSTESLVALENPGVIRVDQDSLGLQAVKVAEERTGLEVWSKKLARPGERAVLLLNRTGEPALIAVEWSDLGLLGSVSSSVKDLWTGKETVASAKPISATVQGGDAVMLLAKGEEDETAQYKAEAIEESTTSKFLTACSSGREFQITHVGSRSKFAAIQISYTNRDPLAHAAELRVNGQNGTRIVFPPTGSEGAGAIWIEASLDWPGPRNSLTFATDCSSEPEIEAITLR